MVDTADGGRYVSPRGEFSRDRRYISTRITMGVAGPTHDKRSWTFDLDPGGRDPVLDIERRQEAFFTRFPDYDRGITVPAIVDIPTGQVVTNDFAQITLDLSSQWRSYHRPGAPELCPEQLRAEIDAANDDVFRYGRLPRWVRRQPRRL